MKGADDGTDEIDGEMRALLAGELDETQDPSVLIRSLRREIEERRRTEAALRSSEQRLRSYFELGLLGVAVSSPDKGWVDINDALCKMLGYSREELLRLTWPEITHPDDLASDLGEFNRVLAGEQDGYALDKRFIRKDGAIMDASISVKCARRPDGSVDYFVAFVQDTTGRKEAERRLRALERRLVLHLERTPLGVIEWTADLKVGLWNPAAVRIFGYPEQAALGMPMLSFVPEPVRPMIQALVPLLIAGTAGDHNVNENVTADGSIIVCEWFNAALFDDQGEFCGISSFVQDVTDRVRADAELRSHLATIERQQQAIRDLSVPILQIWDGVLALPLIGLLDSARAADLMDRLLARIVETRSRHAILDLTGVDRVDSSVARHIQELLQAVQLLGARAVVTGIHPAVAQTMVTMGLDLGGIVTLSTMQEALKLCIREAR
jgi:rsbT co-antagonist protein RsbR